MYILKRKMESEINVSRETNNYKGVIKMIDYIIYIILIILFIIAYVGGMK